MDLEGAFLDSEGRFCIVFQKVGSHGPSGPPVPTSLTSGIATRGHGGKHPRHEILRHFVGKTELYRKFFLPEFWF